MKRSDSSAGKRLLSGNEAIALGAWEARVPPRYVEQDHEAFWARRDAAGND